VLEQFLNHIDKFGLCSKSDSILLAVSGGVDSMAMLYLFDEAGFKIGVAHCNFQLRGKESDHDEAFVVQVCKELSIPVFTRRFETEAYAWENSLSTQMAARELRYAWFEELLASHDYHSLATGHHFDDSMETILLNLTRGSSTDGLAGIPVKNGNIVRPLLFATKNQIEKFAITKGMVWREDQSNLTDDYQRNFIRHQIVPRLKELNPSLEGTWKSGIEKIQGDLSLLHYGFSKWKREFVTEEPERISIAKHGLDSFVQAASLLWRYVKGLGFNFEQCKEIIQSLHGQPGKRFFSVTHLLVIDRDFLIVTPHQAYWVEEVIEKDQHETILGPFRLRMEIVAEMKSGIDATEAIVDAEHLSFPLVWRKWKAGDYFHPLGMEHKKKLSDFLIDNKISVSDKETITVLESDGKVVWVVGHRIDDRFKLSANTSAMIRFTVTSASS